MWTARRCAQRAGAERDVHAKGDWRFYTWASWRSRELMRQYGVGPREVQRMAQLRQRVAKTCSALHTAGPYYETYAGEDGCHGAYRACVRGVVTEA